MQGGGARPSLLAYGSATIPFGMAESDGKLDMQNLGEIIKKLLNESRIATKNVVTALPGSAVFTAVVKLPLMNQGELAKAIRYQAEQNIPLKIKDVKIDWQVLRTDQTKNQMVVMIVAAPTSKVERMMSLLEYAGLEVEALETSSIAVSRSLVSPNDPLVMIVDIGGTSTELTIIENGIVSHCRSLPSAGYALTRAISHNLGLDQNQAEQFKRKFGLAQDKLEGQVYKTMRPILANIVDEIQRSAKFYLEEFGGNVTKVILTGGSSKIPELVSFLSANLNLEIEVGNPWASVSYPANYQDQLQKNAYEFALAIGLASREN
ncbi:MAG: type IV pilus assembly protein PilM [Patescibacteria group bacterium]|nr:type IV pilus assembly protein PilM [Patescibacteria group bacterium]MCL5093658.1 type IV pilus assembly protein PilM [Patescibacteria group bacterium]